MSIPTWAHTVSGRLATFKQPVLTKRSAARKKNAPVWPHSRPSAQELAKAGLYFAPTDSDSDNVRCFLCCSDIDEWTASDDPVVEHHNLAPGCGWAVSCYIGKYGPAEDEDPLSEHSIELRAATFDGRWPHDSKRGWRCKTKKMVEAGWSYDPTPKCDDSAKCFYCDLTLDGWERKDDPWQEHQRRAPHCPFFTISEEMADQREELQKKKARAKAKPSSAAATTPDDSDAASLDEGTTDNESTTLSRKGSRKGGAPKKPARAKRQASVQPEPESAPDAKPKRVRGKPKTAEATSSSEETDSSSRAKPKKQTKAKQPESDEEASQPEEIVPVQNGSSARPRGTKRQSVEALGASSLKDPEPKRSRTSSTKRAEPEKPPAKSEERLDSESNTELPDVELSDAGDHFPPVRRESVRSSLKSAAPDILSAERQDMPSSASLYISTPSPSIIERSHSPAEQVNLGSPTPTTQRSLVDQLLKTPAHVDDNDGVPSSLLKAMTGTPFSPHHPEATVHSLPQSSPMHSQSRFSDSTPEPENKGDDDDDDDDDDNDDTVNATAEGRDHSDDIAMAEDAPTNRSVEKHDSDSDSLLSDVADDSIIEHSDDHDEAVEGVETGTLASPHRSLHSPEPTIPGTPAYKPLWEPAESDSLALHSLADPAELPPSLRRPATAAELPATPGPDEAEVLALISKSLAAAAGLAGPDPSTDTGTTDTDELVETMLAVRRTLSADERDMTLEQFVRHCASWGEQRLRWECDRLVGIFEEQGQRAIDAIKSVQVRRS